ncbi:hypothetical protein, partial [Bifidobacterium animalis]|uniref:hypothetical protein n=1 Tax=Bifidobacterium animalis TaxID=28025 RepID=UPI001021FC74
MSQPINGLGSALENRSSMKCDELSIWPIVLRQRNPLALDMAWFLFRISPNSMGDDGIMSKGTRYTDEFKAKAVRLLTESR